VGAHGTGARIPPVDEQVISMKLATPGLGVIEISRVGGTPSPHVEYIPLTYLRVPVAEVAS
jgi:hypothetical protein